MKVREFGFMRVVDILMALLLVIGGLNWGVIGLFGVNLVEYLFGSIPAISRVIYILVGASALYEVLGLKALRERWHCTWSPKLGHPATP